MDFFGTTCPYGHIGRSVIRGRRPDCDFAMLAMVAVALVMAARGGFLCSVGLSWYENQFIPHASLRGGHIAKSSETKLGCGNEKGTADSGLYIRSGSI